MLLGGLFALLIILLVSLVSLPRRRSRPLRVNPEPLAPEGFECVREEGHQFEARGWRDGVWTEEWLECQACGCPKRLRSSTLNEAQDLDARLGLLDSATLRVLVPVRFATLASQARFQPGDEVELVVDVENRTSELVWCSLYVERDLLPEGAVASWLDGELGMRLGGALSASESGRIALELARKVFLATPEALGVPGRTRLVLRYRWHVPEDLAEDGTYFYGRFLLRLSTTGKIALSQELYRPITTPIPYR